MGSEQNDSEYSLLSKILISPYLFIYLVSSLQKLTEYE